jgi:hypothetical protein
VVCSFVQLYRVLVNVTNLCREVVGCSHEFTSKLVGGKERRKLANSIDTHSLAVAHKTLDPSFSTYPPFD